MISFTTGDWFLIGIAIVAFWVFSVLVLLWDLKNSGEELKGKRLAIKFIAPVTLALIATEIVVVAFKTGEINQVVGVSLVELWMEAGVLLIILSWFLMIQKMMEYKFIYWNLLVGLGLVYLGILEHILGQVVNFSLTINGFSFYKVGPVFVSIGFYNWIRRLRKQEIKAEERKRYQQKQTQSLLETIGEGIVITDEDGMIKYINPAFEMMMGFKVSELLYKDPANVFKTYDLNGKALPQELLSNSAAITAKKREMKILMETKAGKKIAILMNSAPVKVADRFRGVVRVIHEFTEDLSVQKQKDDFFSIASHELRTPLTVIAGNVDIVLSRLGKKLNKSELQMMNDVQSSADRLIKMVGDFLNVSRLDQGRIKTNIVALDACKVAEREVDELTVLAKDKGLELSYSCTKEGKLVMADEGLLKQVIINLVGNSIKFTEKGEIKLEQSVKGEMMVMKVIDTGMGIDKESQKKLFLRFQRAMERTLARKVGGTGLGLYISREFVRIMGGDLYLVKSEIDKGTTLEFTLPLAKSKVKVEGKAKAKDEKEQVDKVDKEV